MSTLRIKNTILLSLPIILLLTSCRQNQSADDNNKVTSKNPEFNNIITLIEESGFNTIDSESKNHTVELVYLNKGCMSCYPALRDYLEAGNEIYGLVPDSSLCQNFDFFRCKEYDIARAGRLGLIFGTPIMYQISNSQVVNKKLIVN